MLFVGKLNSHDPVNSLSSNSSYPDESVESSFTDLTSIASDLCGDIILSFDVLSDSEFPVGELDDSSRYSSASRIGWDSVG